MYEFDAGRRIRKIFMQDQWLERRHYHIIGKAIPDATLFRDDEDRRVFLRDIVRDKLMIIFEIYVYCLCGNHFHLVVETLDPRDVRILIANKKPRDLTPSDEQYLRGEIDYSTYVYRAFNGAISAYARKYNHRHKRRGQLFVKPTLHGLTTKGAGFGVEFSRRLAAYVGLNYVKHHIAGVDEYFHWSSLCRRLYGIVDELRLFDFFGSKDDYLAFHHTYLKRYGTAFWAFDEDDLFANAEPRRYDRKRGAWELGEWRPEP